MPTKVITRDEIQEDDDNTYTIDLKQFQNFFENYKTLEPGKWVKVQGWDNADAARKAIVDSVNAYKG